jgi:hypothetical protein
MCTAPTNHKPINRGVPAALIELITLGRTLKRRAADVLAYFDRPGTSNGPTETSNGRLEHLRGTALAFRNLTNYITRALQDTGGFRPKPFGFAFRFAPGEEADTGAPSGCCD